MAKFDFKACMKGGKSFGQCAKERAGGGTAAKGKTAKAKKGAKGA